MTANTSETIDQAVVSVADIAGKYLTFKLGAEDYGLEILKVQEIIKIMDITMVPRMPEYVKGVINLRGKVIPVIDIRNKFGMEVIDQTERTCIIVVQVAKKDLSITMGLMVDEVSEVIDISQNDIEPAPEMGAAVGEQFILGMAKVGDCVIILLDVNRVMSEKEVEDVSQ